MKPLDFSVKNAVISPFSGRGIRLCAALFLLLTGQVVFAVNINGLYQGAVEVESRDSTRERDSAFTQAFRQVLVKVSGQTDIVDHPVIRRAVNNADDYVDTWSYNTIQTAPEQNAIELNVSFFEPQVLNLLDTAGIPLWPRNRPYTLVWAVVEDELGERELIGSSSAAYPEVRQMLETNARNRGLPLLLPILDFDDRRAVSGNDVWELNADTLLQASARYQSESVLAIRLFRTVSGEILGKSSYLFRGQVFEQEVFEADASDFINASVAMVANELSAYYAVLLSGTDSSMEVNLTVEGIDSAEDYAGLLDYVGELTDVNAYQVNTVNNKTISLKLSTGGQLRQLVENIALNRSMLPLGELVREENQVYMSYQWNE